MTTQKRAFIALCFISSTMLMWSVTNPMLAYIIQSYPDVAVSRVTSILTIPGLVALFVSFLIGPLALKINKKYILLFTVGTTLIYYSIFAVVGGSGPFVLLLVAAGILGINRGAGIALVNSSIAEFLNPEKRAANIALCAAIMQGGAAFMATVGGRIASASGGENWAVSHYLGFLCIPAMIAFAAIMPKKPDEETPPGDDAQKSAQGTDKESIPGEAAKNERSRIPMRIFAIIALQFAFIVCFSAYFLNSSIYIIIEYELGTSADAGLVSSTFTMIGVLTGLTYKIWGKILKKWIVPFGYTIAIFGILTMLSVTTTIAGIWAAAVMISIGFNLANPYVSSKVISLSPKKYVPVFMSIHIGCTNLAIFLASSILGFFGGFLGSGVAGALRVAAILLPCCAVAASLLFPLEKNAKILATTQNR